MKKALLLGVLFTASVNVFSQTKKIAHRSHSGKNSTLILTTEDNFGLPNNAKKKNTVVVKKDTVIRKKIIRKKKPVKKPISKLKTNN